VTPSAQRRAGPATARTRTTKAATGRKSSTPAAKAKATGKATKAKKPVAKVTQPAAEAKKPATKPTRRAKKPAVKATRATKAAVKATRATKAATRPTKATPPSTAAEPALATYRKKRDPTKTPEPMGRAPKGRRSKQSGLVFVIQEHHATALHWDFRLERDGVLVSWAVPKGIPLDPGNNRLAVHTEDHPLDYGTFEGEIPKGEYGGGTVILWDHGHYECEKWTDREVIFQLHGSRVSGRYVLFKTGGKNWMMHRMDPAPAGWEPMPEEIEPMLAALGTLPANDSRWAYEFKWDGIRAVTYIDGGRVRALTRNGNDVSEVYPELRGLGLQLGATSVVLDGELVAMDDEGRPSFAKLQNRMQVRGAAQVRRAAAATPVNYLIFDVLYLDGRLLVNQTYDERRSLLESLAIKGSDWVVTNSFTDVPGDKVLDVARSGGLEGLVAKLRTSRYQPGRRSDAWIKVKLTRTQDVVIGGWAPGKGSRQMTFGALLVGVPGKKGLEYVGKVGTGFTDKKQAELLDMLRPLARAQSPFVTTVPSAHRAGATWVEPKLVGEVRFTEWTKDGQIRHSVWRGLRPDKDPGEVVHE
jgi:bifunctional non-homologous end joining protein LigD